MPYFEKGLSFQITLNSILDEEEKPKDQNSQIKEEQGETGGQRKESDSKEEGILCVGRLRRRQEEGSGGGGS
jgi:hypothetical protein